MTNIVPASVVSSERPGLRAGLRSLFEGYRYLFRTPDIWPLVVIPVVIALILSVIFGFTLVEAALF